MDNGARQGLVGKDITRLEGALLGFVRGLVIYRSSPPFTDHLLGPASPGDVRLDSREKNFVRSRFLRDGSVIEQV